MEITARVMSGDKVARTINVDLDIPSNVAGLVKKFGETVIVQHVIASLTIAAQSYMRSLANPKRKPILNDTQVRNAMRDWKPGMSNRKPRDPVKTRNDIVKRVLRLSDDDRAKIFASLNTKGSDMETALNAIAKKPIVKSAPKRKAA
jgi:hypothetical protein